jgi:DNA-binding CsgD family transcriptional regulator
MASGRALEVEAGTAGGVYAQWPRDAYQRGQICLVARDLGHTFTGEDAMGIVGMEATVMALQITPSERRALQLLANGSTTNDVAIGLGMGMVETEVLLTRLFAALGAASEGEAIAAAHKRGLVSCVQLPAT